MNALPLIHRELLVASRRPMTWWIRVGVGILTIGFFLFIVTTVSGGAGGISGLGPALFGTLTFIAFLLAALSGARSAGIPLSEENRENTLGLLLLTTMRRFDLVLGKLVAATLQGTAGLLAFVPVLALALMVGGVTINQVWMAAATLLLVLLLSNAAGLYVAAIRTNDLQVVLRTLGAVLVMCLPFGWMFLGIALTTEIDAQQRREVAFGQPHPWRKLVALPVLWAPYLGLLFWSLQLHDTPSILLFANPAYLLFLTLAAGSPLIFCLHLAGAGWLLLFLVWTTSQRLAPMNLAGAESEAPGSVPTSSVFMPQEDATPLDTVLPGRPRQPTERPAELINISPILWWLHPPESRRQFIWIAAIVIGLAGFQSILGGVMSGALIFLVPILFLGSLLLGIVLDFLVAWQAARFLAEARQSGSLELLLVTPGFRLQAVRDIWRSLRATFLKPVLVMFALRLLGTLLALFFVTDSHAIQREYGLPVFLARTLGEMTSLVALAWLGIWESWHSRRPAFAAAKAFIIASLLPMILSLPFASLGLMWHFSTLVWQTVMLVLFVGLAAYARARVNNTFLAGSPPVELRRT